MWGLNEGDSSLGRPRVCLSDSLISLSVFVSVSLSSSPLLFSLLGERPGCAQHKALWDRDDKGLEFGDGIFQGIERETKAGKEQEWVGEVGSWRALCFHAFLLLQRMSCGNGFTRVSF